LGFCHWGGGSDKWWGTRPGNKHRGRNVKKRLGERDCSLLEQKKAKIGQAKSKWLEAKGGTDCWVRRTKNVSYVSKKVCKV